MIRVLGKSTVDLDSVEFAKLREEFDEVAIDVGTGDGRFAYGYAGEHPETLVIGLDPVREAMREFSARAAKRPSRGGLPNLLYVVGSIEQPPLELTGAADRLFVNLPWGSLMRGLILAEDTVVANLAGFGAPQASVRIVLNTRIFDEPVPLEAHGLPEVTVDYAEQVLRPAYLRHGIEIDVARFLTPEEMLDLGTTWARRLSHRFPPPSFLIEGRCVGHNIGAC